MPRENRKRGKKHKKKNDAEEAYGQQLEPVEELPPEPRAGPSWIVPATNATEFNPEAPFGYVDAEVKAYFRTVDLQIREWQEEGVVVAEGGEDVDPNEDRHLFFMAALAEMSGKEKQLATDPDCSSMLERMAYSMDDFVRRVFVDRLNGSFEQLLKHRFASHVCQTLFTVANDTISRESRGIFPPVSESSDEGELRTLTQLVLDACDEVLPSLPTLVMDPFGSHVIRALLLLLAPDCITSAGPDNSTGKPEHSVRSKKSAAYKARQGPMKSVFSEDHIHPLERSSRSPPKAFHQIASKFILNLRDKLGENEVRAFAANQVASPVLQMLLEVEAGLDMADVPDSLMDRALVGLITLSHDDPSANPEASDYLSTLLRDPTASHLLETLVARSPSAVFDILWATYFKGKLSKLAVHPVANYVVAKALERVSSRQLGEACDELDGSFGKIIKTSRTGVLRAMVDRAAALQAQEAKVAEAICSAFELTTAEDKKLLVPCVLRVRTLEDYKAALTARGEQPADAEKRPSGRRGRSNVEEDPLEPKTQGAVLLQAMLRLPAPHNELVIDSIQALSMDEVLAMAHHVTSSRVLDAVLDVPTVPAKAKRKFVLDLMGHYHVLVDDRIGSRVGDRCWAYADPYLKEKIARSLIPHEHFLAGSFYGKFFTRHLNLHLLQRNVDEWKNQQSSAKSAQRAPLPPLTTTTLAPIDRPAPALPADTEQKHAKRKRKARPEDEIDALFDAALGKKVKKGRLGPTGSVPAQGQGGEVEQKREGQKEQVDKVLKDVLGAIKAAPKEEKGHSRKKRAHFD
ncbi:Nucleolar protein [Sparassis crispa]|uniref:Nucleolar protein 9 n=1 Tax=Sparassis crispa TaxID=139825 RepID=A0A401GAK0_9APHY|nr:Nucleolar protein [Sparassis crispa]GBE79200.1 Nucleolar protein [Sparassis crispa]